MSTKFMQLVNIKLVAFGAYFLYRWTRSAAIDELVVSATVITGTIGRLIPF